MDKFKSGLELSVKLNKNASDYEDQIIGDLLSFLGMKYKGERPSDNIVKMAYINDVLLWDRIIIHLPPSVYNHWDVKEWEIPDILNIICNNVEGEVIISGGNYDIDGTIDLEEPTFLPLGSDDAYI